MLGKCYSLLSVPWTDITVTFYLSQNHKPLKYCDHNYLQLTLGKLYCKSTIANGWLLIGMSPELHRELHCMDRTMLILHFWGFQVIQHSGKFLQFLDPTRQAESSEMEKSYLSNCCWYARSSGAKIRLSMPKHDWSLCTTLLTAWPAALNIICRSPVLPLPQMWLTEASKLSPGVQIEAKTRQTHDNCRSAHFLKKETKKKIQRHSQLHLLRLPNKLFHSFQIEGN